jgi:hypothetical protein
MASQRTPDGNLHVAIAREDFLRCAQVFHDAMNEAQKLGFKPDEVLVVLQYTLGAYLRRVRWPFDPTKPLELVARGFEGKEQYGLLPTTEVIKAMDKLAKETK